YATPADLPDGTENPDTKILLASAVVREATLSAVYDVQLDGIPEDPDLADLFKAATVAQINYWQALGIDPAKGAADVAKGGVASSKSIGSASISHDSRTVADVADARRAALNAPGPEAAAILAALPHGAVHVYG
ncbi:MAG: hypothetical protein L0J31_09635, partial [Corynebacterium sp.]|nr:hypothetical protein [Corynebacterium sp.]